MSITLNLRYQKQDQYGSEIFIVSNKYPEEQKAYTTLLRIEQKLKDREIDTFLPVYSNKDIGYATVRFKMFKGIPLTPRDTYTVTFDVTAIMKNEKMFINCYIKKIKLHTRAKPIDTGVVLDLELF